MKCTPLETDRDFDGGPFGADDSAEDPGARVQANGQLRTGVPFQVKPDQRRRRGRGAGRSGGGVVVGHACGRGVDRRRMRSVRGVCLGWLLTRAAFALGLIIAHAGSRRALLPGDVAYVYFDSARHLMSGAVPYLEFPYEYPPATLPVLGLTWLLGGHSRASFVVIWCLLMVVLDAVVTRQLVRFRFGVGAGHLWVVGVCLLGPTVMLRNDLVVVASFVTAFLVTAERGTLTGGALWMLGVLAKVWPVAPMAGLLLLRRPGRLRLVIGSALTLAVTLAMLVSTGALGAMINYLFDHQGRRPIEIESLWATPTWVTTMLTESPARVVHSFGSDNLAGTSAMGTIATLCTLGVQVACVVAPALLARRAGVALTAQMLAWVFAVYVSATLMLAPVASPQYALWLLGAACILTATVGVSDARGFIRATLAACILTQILFPALFAPLQRADPLAVIVLVLRNLALIAAFAAGVRGLRRTFAVMAHLQVQESAVPMQAGR